MKPSRRSLLALPLLAFAPAAAAQNQLWIDQFGTSSEERALAAAPDGSGGMYVGGWTLGSLGGSNAGDGDAWLARYDGSGNQLWVRQLGTSGVDHALAAAPDGAGGVYVSGITSGSLGGQTAGGEDAWLAHYDGVGHQMWIRQLGTSGVDWALAAAPDGAGGVYVSGMTSGSLGGQTAGGEDAWLAHYDGVGNQVWIRQLGTSSVDWALAAAPDGAGGVYVSGETWGSLGGQNAGSSDAWLARYDGAGNQLWVRQLGTSGVDHALAAAPDGAGGVYMSGETLGNLGGPNAGAWDAWLARYDGAGNQLWIRQLGSPDSDRALAAAPDGSGGVFVGGRTDGSLGGPNAGGEDAWVARYTADLGTLYCSPAIPNSTGLPGVITATGTDVVTDNDVTLVADQLPPNQFGYFFVGQTQGSFDPPGIQGIICIAGNVGRYNQVGNIIQGPSGSIQIDLTAVPVNPPQAVLPGDTWNFQCVYRDVGNTASFTDAVSVTFQ